MKRLIALLILLLAVPSLASAQFLVTTGSGSVNPDGGFVTFAGVAFSGSAGADNCTPCGNFFLSPGDDFSFRISNDIADTAHVDAVAGSPPLVVPNGASGLVQIDGGSSGPITGPGTYHGSFDFDASVTMAPLSAVLANPTLGCDTSPPLPCTLVDFSGSGTVTLDVVPAGFDGLLEIENEKAILTFRTPEPSTATLLLLGFAGLALLGRRKSRVMSLPAR